MVEPVVHTYATLFTADVNNVAGGGHVASPVLALLTAGLDGAGGGAVWVATAWTAGLGGESWSRYLLAPSLCASPRRGTIIIHGFGGSHPSGPFVRESTDIQCCCRSDCPLSP